MGHALSHFRRNAIAGFVADSLVYGPGYTFTVTAANGTKMNWHEAAQAYLEFGGLSVANASFPRRSSDLLDYALVPLAQENLLKSLGDNRDDS